MTDDSDKTPSEQSNQDDVKAHYKHLINDSESIKVFKKIRIVERYPDKARPNKNWVVTPVRVEFEVSEDGKNQNQIRRVERDRVTSHIELHVSRDVDCGHLADWLSTLNENLQKQELPITKVLFSYGKKAQQYHHIKLQLDHYTSQWSWENDKIQEVWKIIDAMDLIDNKRVYYQLGAKARIYEKGTTIERQIQLLEQKGAEKVPQCLQPTTTLPPQTGMPLNIPYNFNMPQPMLSMQGVAPLPNPMFQQPTHASKPSTLNAKATAYIPPSLVDPVGGYLPPEGLAPPFFMEGMPFPMMPTLPGMFGMSGLDLEHAVGSTNSDENMPVRSEWDTLPEEEQPPREDENCRADLKSLSLDQLQALFKGSLHRLMPKYKKEAVKEDQLDLFNSTSNQQQDPWPLEDILATAEEWTGGAEAPLSDSLFPISDEWGGGTLDGILANSNWPSKEPVESELSFPLWSRSNNGVIGSKTTTNHEDPQVIPSPPPSPSLAAPDPPKPPSRPPATTTLNDGSLVSKIDLLVKAISGNSTNPIPYVKIADSLSKAKDHVTLMDGTHMTKIQLYKRAIYFDNSCAMAYGGLAECVSEGEVISITLGADHDRTEEFTKAQLHAKAALLCKDSKMKAQYLSNLANALPSSQESYKLNDKVMTKEELFKEAISLDDTCSDALLGLALCAF